jgi:hypothetical protein
MLCHQSAKVRNAYLKYAKDAIFEQGVYFACGSLKIVEAKVNVWASRRIAELEKVGRVERPAGDCQPSSCCQILR